MSNDQEPSLTQADLTSLLAEATTLHHVCEIQFEEFQARTTKDDIFLSVDVPELGAKE